MLDVGDRCEVGPVDMEAACDLRGRARHRDDHRRAVSEHPEAVGVALVAFSFMSISAIPTPKFRRGACDLILVCRAVSGGEFV